MNKILTVLIITMISLMSISAIVLAQDNSQMTGDNKVAQIRDNQLIIYEYVNKEEYKYMYQNMNQVSTQEMAKLGNYTQANTYQNRYNQTILSIQKQSKFLNLFQWQKSYEYQIVNGTLNYQPKWYDFMWGVD